MTTPNLLADLRRDEGLRLAAYPDPLTHAEPWTIGYGHTGPDVGSDTTWTCHGCSFENPMTVTDCGVCGVKTSNKDAKARAKGWTCYGCSAKNKFAASNCIACCSSKQRSEALLAVLKREQAEAEAKERREQAEEEARQRAEEAAEAEAKAREEQELLSQGRFAHPGSYTGCGGNPTGYAQVRMDGCR